MIYFISDFHLGLGERSADKKREQMLLQFLEQIQHRCERLFILGDLFDYWFEYSTVIPKLHIRTLAAFARYADAGIPVDYVIGNHDFGHHTFFQQELGIRIHYHDLPVELYGKKFYLAHGDGKALNDTGYLILRAILRHKLSLWLWKWLHPDIGVGLAASVSRKSRVYTSEKKYGDEENGLEIFAKSMIARGYDYVLMGHLHQPLVKSFTAGGCEGMYLNTGDWLVHNTFAQFDGTTLHLCTFDPT